MSTGEAIARIRPVVEAASDDDLHDLWTRRNDLGTSRFVAVVEGLLLAAMADRGMDPPPIGDPPPDPPAGPASRPPATATRRS